MSVLQLKNANIHNPKDGEMTVWPFAVEGVAELSFHYKKVLYSVLSESQGLGRTQESILSAIQEFLEAGGQTVFLDADLPEVFVQKVKAVTSAISI